MNCFLQKKKESVLKVWSSKGKAIAFAMLNLIMLNSQWAIAEVVSDKAMEESSPTLVDKAVDIFKYSGLTPEETVNKAASEANVMLDDLLSDLDKVTINLEDIATQKKCIDVSTNKYAALAEKLKRFILVFEPNGRLSSGLKQVIEANNRTLLRLEKGSEKKKSKFEGKFLQMNTRYEEGLEVVNVVRNDIQSMLNDVYEIQSDSNYLCLLSHEEDVIEQFFRIIEKVQSQSEVLRKKLGKITG